ncbi:MAG: ABC transporter permease [Lachnospiraceae bacterium]|nr:ABC transporter permease [Lachnospiraceae bacterium]
MKYYVKMVRPYMVWSFLLIVIPMLLIAIYSVTTGGNTLVNIQFTLENFAKFAEPIYVQVFVKSLQIGLITVGICLALGYTLAYQICRFEERIQSSLILLVTIPMWINTLLRTYAWISILSDNGIINTILQALGLEPVTLMYTNFAVIIGMVSDFLPFMVIPIHTSLSKIDKSLIEAAQDLGATPFQTFTKVIFKLSIPGVLNGVIVTFLLSISTFVIPKLLGGGQYTLIGNLIENQFISVGNWNFGSALSLILTAVILLAITLMRRLDQEDKEEEL